MSKLQQIEVFWTGKGRERHTISKSEEEAWSSLDRYWAYDSSERDQWSVESSTECIPLVIGELVYSLGDDPKPHIRWKSPYSEDVFDTDLDPGEHKPALWYCEDGSGIALVDWN